MAKETVKVKIPFEKGKSGDYWCALNGTPYLIKRGEYVEVPVAVAKRIEAREVALAEFYAMERELRK